VGINYALGAAQMKRLYNMLVDTRPGCCHVYPGAGLPCVLGGYDEDLEMISMSLVDYAKDGLLHFVGGCCGTFPWHIAALAKKCSAYEARRFPEFEMYPYMQASSLEPALIKPEIGLQCIGVRCYLMGSPKFAKLVEAYIFDADIKVRLRHCEKSADFLDSTFDSDLFDGQFAVSELMRLCVTEPKAARLLFIIDSSKWGVLCEALKCAQGKCIICSISLKLGEEGCLHRAKLCVRYGGDVVIMAFDEQGQVATFINNERICQHSYKSMHEQLNLPPEDIIFCAVVLMSASDLPEHDYAVVFINAVAEIKHTCPCVSFSSGLCNLFFPSVA
jgi:5-methyltetrahydrofolate--homocysteine methyltransferase